MLKNASPLKKYLIYNRMTGSYNMFNWILTTLLTTLLLTKVFDQPWVILMIKIIMGVFWTFTFFSFILFIYKSFPIQKQYDKEDKKIVLYSILSLFIPFIFNFLIRRRLRPFRNKEKLIEKQKSKDTKTIQKEKDKK